MIKNGRVEVGKTPSVVSGEKSQSICEGEPVRRYERPVDPGLRKLASLVADSKSMPSEMGDLVNKHFWSLV